MKWHTRPCELNRHLAGHGQKEKPRAVSKTTLGTPLTRGASAIGNSDMTNTQRVTTVRRDSADSFAHSGNPETTITDQTAKPFLFNVSVPNRQGAPQDTHGCERSVRPEVRPVPSRQTFRKIVCSGPGVALLDNDAAHATILADRLRGRPLTLTTHCDPKDALQALHRDPSAYDVVVVNVSDVSQPWLAILRRLLEACSSHNSPHTPLFLCTSRIKRDPQFQLAIERLGVRFVYER